jgi:hypothetical protein
LKLKRGIVLLFLLAAAGCGEADPMARTDDLWPGYGRAAAAAFPDAQQIEAACAGAAMHLKEVAERTPGTHVDLELADFPVRGARCRWEPGSAATAICLFGQTGIALGGDRRSILRRTAGEWTAMEARLVHVGSGGGTWIAPEGCVMAARPR